MNKRFSLLTISNGNPPFLGTFLESIADTADNLDDIEVILRVDNNDPTLDDYYPVIEKAKVWVSLLIGPPPIGKVNEKLEASEFFTLGDLWNECWRNSTGDILQLCGDDIIYETPGWDSVISYQFDQYPDNILMVSANDMRNRAATHPFIHRQWPEVIGYFAPPKQVYGNDSWLEQVARNIKRFIWLDDIIISHKKHGADEARIDRMRQMQQWKRGHNIPKYAKREDERLKDAEKLQEYINEIRSL